MIGTQSELGVLSLVTFKVAITKDINDQASMTTIILHVIMKDTSNDYMDHLESLYWLQLITK